MLERLEERATPSTDLAQGIAIGSNLGTGQREMRIDSGTGSSALTDQDSSTVSTDHVATVDGYASGDPTVSPFQYTTLDTWGELVLADRYHSAEGLMEFDLSGIAPGSTVVSASLVGSARVISYNNRDNSVGADFYGYVGDGEVTLADVSAPTWDGSSTPVGTISGVTQSGPVETALDKAFVQAFVNGVGGSHVAGLRMQIGAKGDQFALASLELSAYDTPPTLRVVVENNNPPRAEDDSYNVAEDAIYLNVVAPGVLANDSDPMSLPLTAELVSGPSHGTFVATLKSNGAFLYRPSPDFNGTDRFTYRVSNGQSESNVATVTIHVIASNDAPVSRSDSYRLNPDSDLNIEAPGLLANDSDVDSTNLSAVLRTSPTHGNLSLNSDGSFHYTPDAGFNGIDSFTYQATDGERSSVASTVQIVVSPPPTALDDVYSTVINTPLVLTTAHVTELVMESDWGDYIGGGQPYHYSLDNSSISVHAPANFSSVHVSVSDKGEPYDTWFLDFGTADGSPLQPGTYLDAQRYAFHSPDNPGMEIYGHGRGSNALRGQFTIKSLMIGPDSTVQGLDVIFEQHSEGHPAALRGEIKYNASLTTDGLLANDQGPQDLPMTTVLVTNPSHGTLSLNSDGTFSYTPDEGFHGIDRFTYKVTDGQLDSEPATVTIHVDEALVAPAAVDDDYGVNQNNSLSVDPSGILANDTSPTDAPLTAILSEGPAHGVLDLSSDGSFTYTPDADFSGEDFFTYRADNGRLSNQVGTVRITVRQTPIAQDDSYTTGENTPLTLSQTIVTQLTMKSDLGDFVGDGKSYFYTSPASSITGRISTAHNSVSINIQGPGGPGDFWTLEFGSADGAPLQPGTYLNAQRYAFHSTDHPGMDIFGQGRGSNALTGQFTIKSLVIGPDSTLQSLDLVFEQHSEGHKPALRGEIKYHAPLVASSVLSNDSDPRSLPLTLQLLSDPSHGALSLNADGTFSYAPDEGYHGLDRFSYKVNDGQWDSDPATVTILVDDPPTAQSHPYLVNENGSLTIATPGLLDGASDPNGDPLTVVLDTPPRYGDVSVNPDGSFTYTPRPGVARVTDDFTYVVHDGWLDSASAVVSINIVPINVAPVATDQSQVTYTNWSLRGVLKANDIDDDPLRYSIVMSPAHGSITDFDVATGDYLYEPDLSYHGQDSFTFLASDGSLSSNIASVSFLIDDAPMPGPDSWYVIKNSTFSVSADWGVLSNDTDQDNDPLTAILVKAPLHGTLTLSPDGSFVYVPNHGFSGKDNFTYRVSDGMRENGDSRAVLTVGLNRQAMDQQGDYDGDGKADLMVYRPETATFFVRRSNGTPLIEQWGWADHDMPLIGDYDGDGRTDLAVFRPQTDTFYVKLSSGGMLIQQWGWVGHDQPLTGDYDGDGRTDIAVFRAESATFYVRLSSGGTLTRQWGWSLHDQPVTGDYDGDGRTDIAVFRPENATFYVDQSSGGGIHQAIGTPRSMVPIVGDFDGDGKTDFVVYEPDLALFVIQQSSNGLSTLSFGWAEHDLPLTGDFRGDGKTDLVAFRPETSTFYVGQSISDSYHQQWGWVDHDHPVLAFTVWDSVSKTYPSSVSSRVRQILDRYGLG